MKYYKKSNDTIEKYNVTYDWEEILNLREEIMEDCYEVYNFDYDCLENTKKSIFNDEENKNIRCSVIDVIPYKNGAKDYIIHVNYDRYEYPNIVKQIDDFLEGKDVIDDIFDPNNTAECNELYDEVSKALKEIDSLADMKDKLEKLNSIENTIKKSNSKKRKIAEYYLILQGMIDLKLERIYSRGNINKLTNNKPKIKIKR